jgi:hypothetical protein
MPAEIRAHDTGYKLCEAAYIIPAARHMVVRFGRIYGEMRNVLLYGGTMIRWVVDNPLAPGPVVYVHPLNLEGVFIFVGENECPHEARADAEGRIPHSNELLFDPRRSSGERPPTWWRPMLRVAYAHADGELTTADDSRGIPYVVYLL